MMVGEYVGATEASWPEEAAVAGKVATRMKLPLDLELE